MIGLVPLAGWDPFRTTDGNVDAGNQAFGQGRYDDAIHDYEHAGGGVDRGGLDYDLGTARLKAADAEKDPKKKQQLHDDGMADLAHAAGAAKDPRVRAQAAYNRGNAFFSDGKLDDAVTSYKQALRENPELEDARLNLELALRHRKKEQQQQQQQGQGQGQQGQQGQQPQQPPPNGQGQGQGQGQGSGQGQNPQPNGQGQPGQGQPGQGSNQANPQQGSGQGSNSQNPQQGQGQGSGSQDPNQQAPQPKLPGGHGGSGSAQQKTPGDENLDQLEGESRDQRRNQAQRHSNETYHPTDPEDW
jgi:tetratricopeptide (TPR) repeat protein